VGLHGATGATGGAPTIPVDVDPILNRPYVNISIGGGPTSQVTLDTGSIGLIVPPQDVNFTSLGTPTQTGLHVTYGNGSIFLTEYYDLYNTTVNFGNGIITTTPTQVGVITSVTQEVNGVSTIYPATGGIATLGVGASTATTPYHLGPLSTSPVQDLPGTLSQGLLINEPGGTAQFGGNPAPDAPSTVGASITTLGIQINGGGITNLTNMSIVDSGGLWGDVPSTYDTGSVGGYVPRGTTINIYVENGTQDTSIFQETVGFFATAPVVGSSGDLFNTGNTIFEAMPIYLGYSPSGIGTMYFE
jgi:hypothetical protein